MKAALKQMVGKLSTLTGAALTPAQRAEKAAQDVEIAERRFTALTESLDAAWESDDADRIDQLEGEIAEAEVTMRRAKASLAAARRVAEAQAAKDAAQARRARWDQSQAIAEAYEAAAVRFHEKLMAAGVELNAMRKLADALRVALPDNDRLATSTISQIHPARVQQWLELANFSGQSNSLKYGYRSAEATGQLLKRTVQSARDADEGVVQPVVAAAPAIHMVAETQPSAASPAPVTPVVDAPAAAHRPVPRVLVDGSIADLVRP